MFHRHLKLNRLKIEYLFPIAHPFYTTPTHILLPWVDISVCLTSNCPCFFVENGPLPFHWFLWNYESQYLFFPAAAGACDPSMVRFSLLEIWISSRNEDGSWLGFRYQMVHLKETSTVSCCRENHRCSLILSFLRPGNSALSLVVTYIISFHWILRYFCCYF